jgi:hypothetical protein
MSWSHPNMETKILGQLLTSSYWVRAASGAWTHQHFLVSPYTVQPWTHSHSYQGELQYLFWAAFSVCRWVLSGCGQGTNSVYHGKVVLISSPPVLVSTYIKRFWSKHAIRLSLMMSGNKISSPTPPYGRKHKASRTWKIADIYTHIYFYQKIEVWGIFFMKEKNGAIERHLLK